MSLALPREQEASYSAIIDSILAASDLHTITAKRIRKGLQEKVDYDISDQKEAINALIMQRFDKFNSEQNGAPEPDAAEPIPTVEKHSTNGVKQHSSEDGSASVSKKRTPDDESVLSEAEASPPKKKQKKSKTTEEEDAAFAARLQAEENLRSRARSTRGGNTKKKAPAPKKKTKKKSANRIKGEDDSGVETGSDGEKKSPKRSGGFHVCLTPCVAYDDDDDGLTDV